MSWTDKQAIRVINQIRAFYKVKTFIETGTFMGIGAEVQSKNFEKVITVENNPVYWNRAKDRLRKIKNVEQVLDDSENFLFKFASPKEPTIFYLDAHFYNPNGPRWQVKRELEAMKGMRNAIVIIHDFDNNLGHCVYDGERLGMNVVKEGLLGVNPNFHFYTNNLEGCDIMRPEEVKDPVMKDNLKYAWKTPRLTYRGILYATPTELPDSFGLVKIK